ncbi:MAG: hypothetical protein ACK4IY_01260, partial [Chitinophagales bacterium]
VLLAVVVFLTTAGFNIFSHICSISGNQDVSIGKIEACCASNTTGANGLITKESCCTTDQKFVKLDFQAPQPKMDILTEVQWDLMDIQYFGGQSTFISYQIPVIQNNRPPPDIGGSIILRKQSFLI